MMHLPYSTPEAEGVSSAAVLDFVNYLDSLEFLHGFVLFRHGKVIARGNWKPYCDAQPHQLFSLSKSFVSMAIGFLRAEGRLELTDRVISFFPEYDDDSVPAEVREITLHDLLTMRSGQPQCYLGAFTVLEPYTSPYAYRWLRKELKWKPGTHFNYNSGNTYMLSAVVTKLTGQPVTEYLWPRLFQPLGIETPRWLSDPQGINLGGWGLYLKLEDVARFTLLLAQGGKWEGRQLIPEDYLKLATSALADNSENQRRDWENGYGLHFWRCSEPSSFRGDGAYGQYALVIPQYDMALAALSGLGEMGRILIHLWDHLLPTISGDAPLVPNPAEQEALARKLNSLELPKPEGKYAAGVAGGTYLLEANPHRFQSVRFEFSAGGGQLVLRRDGSDFVVPFGYGCWREGGAQIYETASTLSKAIASSAAWVEPNVLALHLACLNEPHLVRYRFQFEGTRVQVKRQFNMLFLYGENEMNAEFSGTLQP
ncbi:MAG: serine hydrolase [Victivallales bacterium]|nr:serine hydrolase [Victivallales bacterium]